MGWFSDALNPVKHFKHMAKGVKATNKGDFATMLDPSGLTAPKKSKSALAAAKTPAPVDRGMYMGSRGPTMFLGGGPNGRSYTPNPFMASPTAQSMAPPQTGMAPPPMMGKMGPGPAPMPMSSPKMPMPMMQGAPQQGGPPQNIPNQAMIMALRKRGQVMG